MAPQEFPGKPVELIRQSGPVDPKSPYDPAKVAGKTIVITGGASGFGAAFAREWAKHGAYIMIGDIDDGAGEELVAELRASTGSEHHHFQHCDDTDWQSHVSLFQMAARASPTGGIDAVVLNAGVGGDGYHVPDDLDMENPPVPEFRVVDVNLIGVMYTVHLALFWLPRNSPDADKPRDRHILFLGSIAGLVPLVGSLQYTASKHAITGLFRSLRGSAHYQGIRVNMLCPYFVDTSMIGGVLLLLLAGGGLGELSDVVGAGTRFMADESIAGRAVVVGPRMKVEDGPDGETRLVRISQKGEDGIWECYAHDYETVETFVYRYTRLLLAFAKMRGWIGWVRDVFWILFFRKPGKKW